MSENDVIVSEQSSDLEDTPEVEANASDAGVDAAAENAHDVSEAAGDEGDTAGDEGDAAGVSEAAGDEGDTAGAGGASAGRGRGARRSLLEREGEVAADFLETLLDIADLDGDIDLDVDGDRAVVAVVDSEEGRVPRRLVGPNGRVLEALQELTRLAVQSATGERSRLMLDVAGFRAERRADLVAQARSAIEKCRTDGSAVELEPMSAFERKVVHDEVLAAGLVSESSGVEPRRYVVVLPAG